MDNKKIVKFLETMPLYATPEQIEKIKEQVDKALPELAKKIMKEEFDGTAGD